MLASKNASSQADDPCSAVMMDAPSTPSQWRKRISKKMAGALSPSSDQNGPWSEPSKDERETAVTVFGLSMAREEHSIFMHGGFPSLNEDDLEESNLLLEFEDDFSTTIPLPRTMTKHIGDHRPPASLTKKMVTFKDAPGISSGHRTEADSMNGKLSRNAESSLAKSNATIGWSMMPTQDKRERACPPMPCGKRYLSYVESAGRRISMSEPAGRLDLQRNFKSGLTFAIGTFGRILTARCNKSGQQVAVKAVLVQSKEDNISEELGFCAQLSHESIVSFLGFDLSSSEHCNRRCLYMIFEFCPGGSIAAQLKIYGPLNDSLLRRYAGHVADGIRYLHSRSPAVMHRDLKCANLLLSSDAHVKIADFGSALQLPGVGTVHATVIESFLWMAPELLLRKDYAISLAADIWSYGCCLLEMASALPPWAEQNIDSVGRAWHLIVATERIPKLPRGLPHDIEGCITACLNRNPDQRPTASELKRLEMFKYGMKVSRVVS